MKPKHILIVDDNLKDAELTLAAFQEHHSTTTLVMLSDGVQALDYLYRRGAFKNRPMQDPDLALFDLKMPKINGLEIIRQAKLDKNLKKIPVIIFTSSREPKDIAAGYELGVNAYVVKPISFAEFNEVIRKILGFWADVNESPNQLLA